MTRRVSILLPTHSRRANGYLERSIESVLAQTHKEFELILIDDASSDGSADLIAWYARQDSRISSIRFDRNVGLPALTTSAGYERATGDFIVATFDDCALLPSHLERLLAAFQERPDSIMAYGQIETHWMSGGSLVLGSAYDALNMRAGNNHIPNACVMLRREAVERFGWYDPHVLLKRFCDWDLWLRIGSAQTPVFVPEILAHEYGTGLADSLGERVTLFKDLMLRYSRTSRDRLLSPAKIKSYDPFRKDVGIALSDQDLLDIDYLVTEHLLNTGDHEELLKRFAQTDSNSLVALADIKARYLARRLKIIGLERNEMQLSLLSLRPSHERQIAEARDQISREQAAVLSLGAEIQDVRQSQAEAQEANAEAQSALAKLQSAVEDERQAFQSASSTAKAIVARLEAELLEARADVSKLQHRAQEHDELLQALESTSSAAEATVARLEAELLAARAEVSRLKQEEQRRRSQLQDLTQRLAVSQAEERRALNQALKQSQNRRDEVERFAAERDAWNERRQDWQIRQAKFSALEAEWVRQKAAAEARFRAELGGLRALQSANVALQHSVEDLQAYSRKLANRLSYVLGSKYWRVSYPIRAVKAKLRGKSANIQVPSLNVRANGDQELEIDALPHLFDDTVMARPDDRPSERAQGSSRNRRIIAIGDGPIPSVEICLSMPLEYMKNAFGVDYEVFYQSRLPDADTCADADLIVMMRLCTAEAAALARRAQSLGVPLIYITDDDFEEIDPATPAGAHYRSIGASENIREIARISSTVLVFSESLRRKFVKYNERVQIVDALSGIEMFDRLPEPDRPLRQLKEIRIGYSGSSTHLRDVEIVSAVLLSVLERYPEVVVETVGQEIPALKSHKRYRHFPSLANLADFTAFQHSRDWDIGLAPLENTPFNRAKSDNKYRTYAAAGIPGVYSNVGPFRKSVKHDVTGLIVSNDDEEWLRSLELLIENTDIRNRMSQAARGDVRARCGLPTIAQSYYSIYLEAMSGLRVLAVGPLHLPTAQIDVCIPFEDLRREGIVHPRYKEVHDVLPNDLLWCDVVVVIRAVDPEALELIRSAKSVGVKTIFTWDDDFFSLTDEHPDLKKYYDSKEIRASMEGVLRESDLIKASTRAIESISYRYNDSVLTAPYGFDFRLMPNDVQPRQDGRIRIGYFGTVGRGAEFQCVLEALKRVADEHPTVDVEFFGYSPPGSDAIPRVTNLPFQDDYAGSILQLAKRQWDIGLAPLGTGSMANAKLPTKYRDYGAAKAAGVYTDNECYRGVVHDGITGLVTDNTVEGWHQAITRLVVDAGTRKAIAEAAHNDVRDNYGLDRVLDAWSDAFRRLGFPIPRQ